MVNSVPFTLDCTAILRSTLVSAVDGLLRLKGMKRVSFLPTDVELTSQTMVFAESDEGDVSCAYSVMKSGESHWTLKAYSVPLKVEDPTLAKLEKGLSWAGKLSLIHAR